MKKNTAARLTFMAIACLCLPVICFAQNNGDVTGGLNGENIVSQENLDWGAVVATSSHIYSTFWSPDGLGGRTYEYIWGPPPPAKIKSIAAKKYPIMNEEGEIIGYNPSESRLVVLLDDGSTYLLDLGHDQTAVFGVLVDSVKHINKPTDPSSQTYFDGKGDDLYILSSAHLYVSKDSATWHVDSSGLNGAHIYSISTDSMQRVYAATDKGLFKQDSGTASFVKISSYAGPQNLAKVFVDRKNRLFIGPNGGGLYSSFDDGTNWQLDTSGIGNLPAAFLADDAYNNTYAIMYDATTNTTHIYKSAGGTGAWQLSDTAIFNKTGNNIAIHSIGGDSVLLAATSFGVFYSTDAGETWHQHNDGITTENINGIAKLAGGKLLVSGSLGIYARNAGETTWNKMYPQQGFTSNLPLYYGGVGNIYAIDKFAKSNYQAGYILKSSDGGNSWSPDTTGLSAIGGSLFFVDENGAQHISNTFYGGSFKSNLWVKPNGGNWAFDTTGFPIANYSFANSMASDRAGYLYVSGFFSGKKIMRRPIAGGAWETDTVGIPSSANYLDMLAGNNGLVAGVAAGKIYYRGNAGWAALRPPGGLLFPVITALGVDGSGYIFASFSASAGSGVYFSSDLGQNWSYAGFDSADVSSFVSYGDTTYLLTRNMGAFLLTHASALPVNFSSINAYKLNKGVQIQWDGLDEINMNRYQVERSADGANFASIGTVAARGGTLQNTYRYFDAAPFGGDNYYRIKATSKNGASQYSGTVKVSIQNQNAGVLVFPNPSRSGQLNMQVANLPAGQYTLAVYNAQGQAVYNRTLTYASINTACTVNTAKLAKGVYWVVLRGKNSNYRYSASAVLQ